MSILLIVGLIAIFYFMLIRPQQKRMRQQMELMKNLRVGDEVMTSSGIYGTVSEVEEDTVLLEVAEDVHIRIAKNAVVKVFTVHEEEEEEEPESEGEEEEGGEEEAKREEGKEVEEANDAGKASGSKRARRKGDDKGKRE